METCIKTSYIIHWQIVYLSVYMIVYVQLTMILQVSVAPAIIKDQWGINVIKGKICQ